MAAKPVQIPGHGRDLDGYLATPTDRPDRRPAVIVVHEIFGPDAHIRDVTARFAARGYVAVAPNLFTGEIQRLLTPEAIAASFAFLRGLPPEVQRDPAKIQERIRALPEDQQRAQAALQRIQDPARHAEFALDLRAVADWLRQRPDVEPSKVLSVGFCFGGGMSGRLATVDPSLAAAVIFYGQSPPSADIPRIRASILGLYGAEDHRITDTVPALQAELERAHVPFRSHVYPGAGHAFFNDTRAGMYNAEAAADAWTRTLEFFASVGAA